MTFSPELYLWSPDTHPILSLPIPDDDVSIGLAQAAVLVHEQSPCVPYENPEILTARAEHGRWLVDCPCGSGVGMTRRKTAFCFSCGARYRGVQCGEMHG